MPFTELATRTASIRAALKMPAADPTEGQIPVWRGGVYAFEAKPTGDGGGGGGGGAWGEITGTLSSQTDLQTALNAKFDAVDASLVATSNQYSDLDGRPTLGSAAGRSEAFFATAAQGAKADTAVQPAGIANRIKSDTTQAGGGTAIANMVEITQAAYDALGAPDASTFYLING